MIFITFMLQLHMFLDFSYFIPLLTFKCRWKWCWDCCQIEARHDSYFDKWACVLARVRFYHIQIHPCPATGNFQDLPCSVPSLIIHGRLLMVILFFPFFVAAIGEQFIFVSMDYLHYIYGELKESERGLDPDRWNPYQLFSSFFTS